MEKLNSKEMLSIRAGGMSDGTIAAICAIGSFIIGIFDGFSRPFRCR